MLRSSRSYMSADGARRARVRSWRSGRCRRPPAAPVARRPSAAGSLRRSTTADCRHDDQRPHRIVAVEDRVRQQRAGQGAAAQTTELGVDEALFGHRCPRPGIGVEAVALQVAAGDVQAAGDEREHVHEPVRERALATHVESGRRVHGRPRRAHPRLRQIADGGRCDAGDRLGALRWVLGDERAQFVHPAPWRAITRRRTRRGGRSPGATRPGTRHRCRAGAAASRRCPCQGLDATRVDEHEPRPRAAARRIDPMAFGIDQKLPCDAAGSRRSRGTGRCCRDPGSGGPCSTRTRPRSPRTCSRSPWVPDENVRRTPQRPQQRAHVQLPERVERRRVADVRRDGTCAVHVDDRLQASGGLPSASSHETAVQPPSAARTIGRSRRSGSRFTSTKARPLWQANPSVAGARGRATASPARRRRRGRSTRNSARRCDRTSAPSSS